MRKKFNINTQYMVIGLLFLLIFSMLMLVGNFQSTESRVAAANKYTIVNNTATGKSCDQKCANVGATCIAVGTNSTADDGNTWVRNVGNNGCRDASGFGKCSDKMANLGTCSDGSKYNAHKCKCLLAN